MKYFTILILIMIIISCSGLKETEQNKIRIKGSDTMLLLNKKLAEEFMMKNEGISVYVDGGGSGTGVKALMNSEVEICAASRPLEPKEIKQIGEKFNTVGMSFLIGRDALSLYVNPENIVKELSLEEVNKIFTCQITNWKEVGGKDEKIIPISRSSASGTHLYFVMHVLKGNKICDSIKILNTTNKIIEFVKSKKNAIGYGGIGYGDSTFHCKIDNIEPTTKNVLNNSYPISRYLRYYTIDKSSGNVKKYIDWVIGKEGQMIIKNMGYIPLWNSNYSY